VFVNGVLELERDKVTGQLGGRPLRGPGYIMRDYLPDGLPPRGKLQGVVTDEGGYPIRRSTVNLMNVEGKVLGTANTKKDGKYELPLDQPCQGCSLKASRIGFAQQTRVAVNYNGSNSLWFSFVLKPARH
jgi:hypothetical protein